MGDRKSIDMDGKSRVWQSIFCGFIAGAILGIIEGRAGVLQLPSDEVGGIIPIGEGFNVVLLSVLGSGLMGILVSIILIYISRFHHVGVYYGVLWGGVASLLLLGLLYIMQWLAIFAGAESNPSDHSPSYFTFWLWWLFVVIMLMETLCFGPFDFAKLSWHWLVIAAAWGILWGVLWSFLMFGTKSHLQKKEQEGKLHE